MKNLHVIVAGANYGDEGKGLMTDYFVENLKANQVVRFNGGAQAGHTVNRGSLRHVFGNFTSGTFQGVRGVLSRDVILNPYAAIKEAEEIRRSGFKPSKLWISPHSPVSTPFDVSINQAIELKRMGARHGSCGLGINETVTRHLKMIELFGQKIASKMTTAHGSDEVLEWIRDEWLPIRMHELGFAPDEIQTLQRRGDQLIVAYHDVLQEAMSTVYANEVPDWPWFEGPSIYEGAQGLGLCEFMGDFPHVTRSNTGIANALKQIALKTDPKARKSIEVVYVTRTYLTRHGAGPLRNECKRSDLNRTIPGDSTNVFGQWQQDFRYAPLDIPAMKSRITADLARNEELLSTIDCDFKATIALTCMDQATELPVVIKKDPELLHVNDIRHRINEEFRFDDIEVGYVSYGPAADKVEIKSSAVPVVA